MAGVVCPTCSAESEPGKRFCADCGTPLAQACPSCGTAVDPGKPFCGDCGTRIEPTPTAAPPPPATVAKPVAERRLTSVLFCDLVGFTTLSESRDAEEVRELLSDYFAMARTVVARYGGTIEKFIGDAVMAVWGVPVAHEDDAERAVRAGLDLVEGLVGVAEAGRAPDLQLRVGILTGEVAVTIGAVGEGMVAGDAVNTAARIQSAAAPGQVWVDETTRSLTAAALTYTDAGEHELKGKAEPVRLYAAGSVVANVGGAQRVDGLEAPFVGRDHELRLVKELFHGIGTDRRARLVAISGLAGVGKTRLLWEFDKYIDGIADTVFWHRSRALSYGDGVSFWAVAEMVRSRIDANDEDPPGAVDAKLAAALDRLVTDAGERDWIQPRLAALLGREASGFGRDDLFAAWATFFERVAGPHCAVLVFDDMQHAHPDLLDFLDHLLESTRAAVLVVTLARPELADARPGWGTLRRATAVHLEPLGAGAMGELVQGLVDGLSDRATDALVERSEGIPLYALEMVRALIDRDAVIPQGGRYVVAPDGDERVDLATVGAPPSLQALIAARLDALTAAERLLVQEATAHGLAFSHDGIAATTTVPDLDAVLAELVRKEVFELDTDRFSSERGQYRFVQSLVRTVAYDTLSRRDRKARHLAVARYLEQADGDEFAAVLARHHLDALDSVPHDADGPELLAAALGHLERAARRAQSLGSYEEALRHYTTALERDLDPADRARFLEGAAGAAKTTVLFDEAVERAEEARALYEGLGERVGIGRVDALIGEVLIDRGQLQDAVDLMTPVCSTLEGVEGADEAVLRLTFVLGRAHAWLGDPEAISYTDRGIILAEALQDWEALGFLFSRRAVLWARAGCPTIADALFSMAVELGRRHDQPKATVNALLNINSNAKNEDLDRALEAVREAVELARQAGVRDMVAGAVLNHAITCWVSGDWDEAEQVAEEHQDDLLFFPAERLHLEMMVALVRRARGEPTELDPAGSSTESEYDRAFVAWRSGLRAELEGDLAGAARDLLHATDQMHVSSGLEDDFPILLPMATTAALAAGQVDEAERLLRYVTDAPPGWVGPALHAHHLRLRALVEIARGGDEREIDRDLERAADELRAHGSRFYLGRTLLELGRHRKARGELDAAAPVLAEAAEVFTALRATPWLAEVRATTDDLATTQA